VFPSGTRPR